MRDDDSPPPPKRRGRPPLDTAGSTTLNVRLSTRQYDDIWRQATRREVSMAEVVRRAVKGQRLD